MKPWHHENVVECGIDEVGRGALCGPVVAAAVIWDPKCTEEFVREINDSKKLSPKKRAMLDGLIREYALGYSISMVGPKVIDEKNIQEATYDAMHDCISKLDIPVEHILVDGNRFRPYPDISHTTVIKGDSKYISIAAASIIAKVARDTYMRKLHDEDDVYGWNTNVGYGTAKHMDAIKKYGATEHHRTTFITLGR